jgi:hypothetical protein
LKLVERVVLPTNSGLGVSLLARGQVIEVENDAVLPRGMTLVNPVKTLFLGRLEFEIYVAGEPA